MQLGSTTTTPSTPRAGILGQLCSRRLDSTGQATERGLGGYRPLRDRKTLVGDTGLEPIRRDCLDLPGQG